MVYGVCVVHNTDDYKKITLQIWRNGNASLLMNKGCEAVFIDEPTAFAYAYEQAERRKIQLDPEIYDVN